MEKRKLFFFKITLRSFIKKQSSKVQKKIIWTLRIIEELEVIPKQYLKHLKNTDGIYEIRVQVSGNIYRVFCFFDDNNIVVIGHGFQKKSQKTPKSEIRKAEKIKVAYYESQK